MGKVGTPLVVSVEDSRVGSRTREQPAERLRGMPPPPGPATGGEPFGAHPLLLLAAGRRDQAAARLRHVPDPPRDLLQEALWCLPRAAVATSADPASTGGRCHVADRPSLQARPGGDAALLPPSSGESRPS
jgi:hypothetical protein